MASACCCSSFIMRFQGSLPLNPQNCPNVEPRLAFNTAVSFVTNTNWQSYRGEMTMSNFTQMVGLAVQNFLSAATGHRDRHRLDPRIRASVGQEIGNFWVDRHARALYVLLPICIVAALVFVARGVPQNFEPLHVGDHARRVRRRSSPRDRSPRRSDQGARHQRRRLLQCELRAPVREPDAVHQPGRRCSRSSSSRPALTYTFGKMVGNTRQGWASWR